LRRSARRVAVRQSAQYAGAIPPCAVASLVLLAAIGTADAADIPIGGTYGTVAMCIIDAFTDVPSAEINYNVGGAPLARVLPGEFDLPTQSCVFQRILSASTSGSKPHWVVEAQCTTETGNVAKVLDLTADKVAHAVAVAEKDGKVLATVDQCSVPYRERLARELKRMAGKSDAAQ
jgi:hypothetical protein